ncbi:site-2 protease family protein [Streptomyces ossamyceticus]|uniref:site-2 protease family protein n=2 Tax=Streptomyces TaxID=1883 RepID=UPI0034293AF7
METSGGSGQPRSGNDDATEHTDGETTHTADLAPTNPAEPTPEGTPAPRRDPQTTEGTEGAEPSDLTDETGADTKAAGGAEKQGAAEGARTPEETAGDAGGFAEPDAPEKPADTGPITGAEAATGRPDRRATADGADHPEAPTTPGQSEAPTTPGQSDRPDAAENPQSPAAAQQSSADAQPSEHLSPSADAQPSEHHPAPSADAQPSEHHPAPSVDAQPSEHPSPSADAQPSEEPRPADGSRRPADALPPEDHLRAAGTPSSESDQRPDATHPPAGPASLRKGPSAGSSAGSEDTASTARPFARGRGPKPPARPKEPGGGILMGRPFGVPVYVAPSWFLVAALITWVFGGQLDRVLPELGALRYLVSLFFAVAFYASVLVHELAHTIAALRFKLPVRRIQLQFFGGVSEIEKESETPGREFVLAFVGPLLSLILAGVFYLALLAVEPGTVPGVLLAGLMISNLIVAAFNLLPGLPLDGGRMLRAVVWKITGKPMSGTVAAAWVGRALALSVLIGLPWLTQSGLLGADATDSVGMDTVLDALLAAILAAIIWTGAGNSLRMARLREHLPELRARALTRRAVPVETDTPLSEALRRANDAGARALVVVDADGEPLSLVREAAIVGVPEHRRPWVVVSGLAQDLTDGMRVSAELAGEELLDALRAAPATEYLVVEETGEIYGVLSAADVERAFVKAMARPS